MIPLRIVRILCKDSVVLIYQNRKTGAVPYVALHSFN